MSSINRDFHLPQPAPRGSRGFSLLEILVSAAVLTLVAAAMFASFSRMQQNAISSRAFTNAQAILRSTAEQAMQRGWDDEANPNGLLSVTVADGAFDSGADTTARNGDKSLKWRRWNTFTGADDAAGTVPVYQDMEDPAHDVSAKLFRKVQRVTGTNTLLWMSFRIEYTIARKDFAYELNSVRAAD